MRFRPLLLSLRFDLCGLRRSMYQKPLTLALKFCIVLLLPAMGACKAAPCPASDPIIRPLTVNGHSLTVEVAATVAARACGLSLRDGMPANHGMLFVYRDERTLVFWMKDTVIPLSIAYLDSDGRILGLHQMDPRQPRQLYSSTDPARYALEVHRGWFRSNGVEVGDLVEFELPADLEAN